MQSVQAIVITAVGSYLGMRHFGSYVPDLVDEPMTEFYIAMHFTAIVTAITRFEPEFIIDEISIDKDAEAARRGIMRFILSGFYKPIDGDVIEAKSATVEVKIG